MKTVMKKIGAWTGAFVMGSIASVSAAQTSAVDNSIKAPTRKVSPQDVQYMPMPQIKPGAQPNDPTAKGGKRSDDPRSAAGSAATQTSRPAAPLSTAPVATAPVNAEASERAVSVVKQTTQIKKGTFHGGTVDKPVGPSSQSLKAIIEGIDYDSGAGSQAATDPNIQGAFAINPTGVVWTLSANVSIPASAWKVSCLNTTSFFNNALGQAVSDDVLTISPATVIPFGTKVTITCPYKTSAHILNIAKRVEASVIPSITSFSLGGITYKSSSISIGTEVCTRASKTDNFSCY